MKSSLTIGKLASVSGVSVETVRFYERKGIIKQPEKHGAYRLYSKDHIDRIYFVKRSQELGFTLKEATELLDLKVNNQAKCKDVLLKTDQKIDEINQKIKDLNKIKKSLERIVSCCEDANAPLQECPVLDGFVGRT